MDYQYSDYGYVSALGQFFIPRITQQESNIKAYKDGTITIVMCSIEDEHIVLRHDKTIPYEEHKMTQSSRPKELRVIDELGRVGLLKEHMETLKISPHDVLVSFLCCDGTIRLRPLTSCENTTQL